jgi:hypothetical protein
MTRPIPQKGSTLPDADHVLRYIRPRHVENGVVNGEGFLMKPDEDAPSVNWVEYFELPIDDQIDGVRGVARLTYAKTGQLARLNVGQTAQHVRENDPNHLVLLFEHDPLDSDHKHAADPSHSLMRGVPVQGTLEATLIGDLIAECVLPPLYPAVLRAGHPH